MRLHFKNKDSESYSQGVTPLLIPGSANGSAAQVPRRSQPSLRGSGVLPYDAGSSGRPILPDGLSRPLARNTRGVFLPALLYLIGIVFVFALPFMVPIGFERAARAVDRFAAALRAPMRGTSQNTTFPRDIAAMSKSPKEPNPYGRIELESNASGNLVPQANKQVPAMFGPQQGAETRATSKDFPSDDVRLSHSANQPVVQTQERRSPPAEMYPYVLASDIPRAQNLGPVAREPGQENDSQPPERNHFFPQPQGKRAPPDQVPVYQPRESRYVPVPPDPVRARAPPPLADINNAQTSRTPITPQQPDPVQVAGHQGFQQDPGAARPSDSSAMQSIPSSSAQGEASEAQRPDTSVMESGSTTGAQLQSGSESVREEANLPEQQLVRNAEPQEPPVSDPYEPGAPAEPVKQLKEATPQQSGSNTERFHDPWLPHAHIHDRTLDIAKTFENRLNNDVAPLLERMSDRLWPRSTAACGGRPSVRFVTSESPHVDIQLEIATGCGVEGSCTLRPILRDFRSMHVSLDENEKDAHFIRTFGADGNELNSWGPLKGELRARLLDDAQLLIASSCPQGKPGLRMISVADLRVLLRRYHLETAPENGSNTAGQRSPQEEAFEFNSVPLYHLSHSA